MLHLNSNPIDYEYKCTNCESVFDKRFYNECPECNTALVDTDEKYEEDNNK